MNTEANLTYFLIGFINGVARPWKAADEDEGLERMRSAARSRGNALFPDLAQDDEAFNCALKPRRSSRWACIEQRLAKCGVSV